MTSAAGVAEGTDDPVEHPVTDELRPTDRGTGQWGLVLLAWALVGVPLLWGVWNTLLKAVTLFQ